MILTKIQPPKFNMWLLPLSFLGRVLLKGIIKDSLLYIKNVIEDISQGLTAFYVFCLQLNAIKKYIDMFIAIIIYNNNFDVVVFYHKIPMFTVTSPDHVTIYPTTSYL